MLNIIIHDVGHGQFAMVGKNGISAIIDCGFDLNQIPYAFIENSPKVDLLVISHFDEDHVSGLEWVLSNCDPEEIAWNPSIGAKDLLILKDGKIRTQGVALSYELINKIQTEKMIREFPIWAPMKIWTYFNIFDGHGNFNSNDLSLAVFIKYGKFKILFAGDLETHGWQMLLRNQTFQRDLYDVNVFVASHHGRKNGQCEGLFRICKPDIFVFSDGEKIHDSQESLNWYRDKASGISYGSKNEYRYILTTRSDGHIIIDVDENGNYRILTNNEVLIKKSSFYGTFEPSETPGYQPWFLTQGPSPEQLKVPI